MLCSSLCSMHCMHEAREQAAGALAGVVTSWRRQPRSSARGGGPSAPYTHYVMQ